MAAQMRSFEQPASYSPRAPDTAVEHGRANGQPIAPETNRSIALIMMLGAVRGYPEIVALFRRFPVRMNWNWLISTHFSSDFEASRHMIVRGSTL